MSSMNYKKGVWISPEVFSTVSLRQIAPKSSEKPLTDIHTCTYNRRVFTGFWYNYNHAIGSMIREKCPTWSQWIENLKKSNGRRAAQSLLHVTLFRHGVSYKAQSHQSCVLFTHALSPFRSAWLVALPFRSRNEVHCVSSCCIFQLCFWDRHRSLFECNKIPRSLVSGKECVYVPFWC